MPEARVVPLYSAAEVRALDQAAIAGGISGYELMCRAGAALLRCIEHDWPRVRRVCVLCGPGNNGGDGYVLARLLRGTDREVRVLALADPRPAGGDAAQAARAYREAGGRIDGFTGQLPVDAELLVDALLGTGLDRAVAGIYQVAIQSLNAHPAAVLAADIPSGLHADSGRVLGVAVNAACTLSFIGRKRGLYTAAGVDHSGRVEFADLDVPAEHAPAVSAAVVMMQTALPATCLPARQRSAHKGDYGHLLVVGGAPGMSGAPRLAAEAAARCGAGLVSVATHPLHAATLNAGRPELMVHPVAAPAELAPLLARATVVAVGPGLGRDAWSQALLAAVLDSALPLVMDADALNLLAADPLHRANWILTPHPGEAGRLLGCTPRAVQEDRFAAVAALQARYGGVAVLKGAGTLVATGTGAVQLCPFGNPGMASGGMGDVLSGVIAALLAQRLELADAAQVGVCVHALAADRCAARSGERGLLAADLLPELRALVNRRD